MNRAAPSPQFDHQAFSELEAYLRLKIPHMPCGGSPVRRSTQLAEDVWEIELEEDRRLVAKHQSFGFLTKGLAHDLLEVEEKLLGLLRQNACPVPRALGCDRAAQIIFLEHVGDRTLDEVLQEDPGSTPCAYARQAISGLQAIAEICRRQQAELEPLVAEVVNKGALKAAWDKARKGAREGLAALHSHLGCPPPTTRAEVLLDEMGLWLASRPPVLGSTDYNARNLIVDEDSGKLNFIEFAKIGWDWTERRLVQYTTSMGSGRENGCIRSLLDARSAKIYEEVGGGSQGTRALDYHHIFFLLNGAALLCSALEKPRPSAAAALLAQWKNPAQRLRQFAAHLAVCLSTDARAREFRAQFEISATSPDQRGENCYERVAYA